jgi:hypothetical protein
MAALNWTDEKWAEEVGIVRKWLAESQVKLPEHSVQILEGCLAKGDKLKGIALKFGGFRTQLI